jgi:hypothetical protein
VRTYLSPQVEGFAQRALFRTDPSEQTPGLRVFVPTAEYMLAMTLRPLAGSGRSAISFVLAVDDLWKEYSCRLEGSAHEPPRHFGRSGPEG